MNSNNSEHREERFKSRDNLSLFYRQFGPRDAHGTAVLCLPGFTRNSKDFIEVAARLSAKRRVLCLDLRGRGRSSYDPNVGNYQPDTYLQDLWALLEVAEVPRVIVIGTSLGGLLAMMMAATRPEAVAGVVLNDVGPEIAPTGLARIAEYIGRLPEVSSWEEAIAQSKAVYGVALPDLTEAQWLRFTRRQYVEGGNGRIHVEYDAKLGDALRNALTRAGEKVVDAWAVFGGLGDVPTLAFRGALSDVLAPEVFAKMGEVKPDLIRVIVPNRGHVPLLDEPECQAALDTFFAKY